MSVFQRQAHPLYFAYGANMHPEQIAGRCGASEPFGVARLADFRLAFCGRSAMWDGAEEVAVPAAGGELWGTLYRLSLEQADRLDEWQGVRPDGSGAYFLFPVEVVDLQGHSHAALLFRKDFCGEPGLPSDAQRDYIVAGAVAQGLPDAYVEQLRLLPVRKATYPVPRKDGPRCGLLSLRCSGCG